MSFVTMRDNLIAHFNQITKDANNVFVVNVDKDEMWNLYLDSFPKGTNEIYRKHREHDCSCCRSFIKAIGNVVVIKNSKITTIWDFNTEDPVYQPSIDALNAFIKSKTVTDVFLSKFNRIGSQHSFEKLEDGSIKTWEHFYLQLPGRFVNNSRNSIPDIQGDFRDTKNVFKRSLDEITENSVLTVLELISSNSLYRGEEWKPVLEKFLQYKRKYMALPEADKDNYAWENSATAGNVIGRIRNHSIGTLLVNISEDMDLDLAVRKYEQIVAPANYKRPKAIFTKKMLDDAKNTIEELGYMDSLARRYATLDDITVNNILFSNKDSAKRISGAGKSTGAAYIFSQLKMAGINAELITEFAKDKVWEENSTIFQPDNQIYIFGKQFYKMNRCKDKVDVIVTDSPLLLSSFYNSSKILGKEFDKTVYNCFSSFNNKTYLLKRVKPYNPKGRLQTEEESDALVAPLMEKLNSWNIPYTVRNGDIKDYDDIVNEVLEYLRNN